MGKLAAERCLVMLLLLWFPGWFLSLPVVCGLSEWTAQTGNQQPVCVLGAGAGAFLQFWGQRREERGRWQDPTGRKMLWRRERKVAGRSTAMEAITVFLRLLEVQGYLASCPTQGSCLWLLICAVLANTILWIASELAFDQSGFHGFDFTFILWEASMERGFTFNWQT